MQHTLLLHLLKLDINFSGLDAADWIDLLYSANDLTARFPQQQATLRLLVERLGAAGVTPLAIPADAIFAEIKLCGAPCYYKDGRFYAARNDELQYIIEYELCSATIRAQLGGAFLLSGEYIVTDLLRPLLQSFILPFYKIKTLHGAVLHKEGRTILLDGPGGAGKSTLGIQLALCGWDLLSDDGPFFTVLDGRACVLSSLDFAYVTEQTLTLFPDLRPLLLRQKNTRRKYALNLRHLQHNACTEPLALNYYIKMRRHACAAPRLSKLDKATLYRELVSDRMVVFRGAPFRTGAYPFKSYSQNTLNLLSLVAQGATAYELEFADEHLAQIPGLLEQL